MNRYSGRTAISDPSRELDAIRDARHALCRILAAYPISGPVYATSRKAVEALDDVAREMTGDIQALLEPGFWVPR